MRELSYKCELVCERLPDDASQEQRARSFRHLLYHVETEHAKLYATRPPDEIDFSKPDWESKRPWAWDRRPEVQDADGALELAIGCYRSALRCQYLEALERKPVAKPRLAELWKLWDDMVRERNVSTASKGRPKYERIPLQVAAERASVVYDIAFRLYRGLSPRIADDYYGAEPLKLRLRTPPIQRPKLFNKRKRLFAPISTYVSR